MKEIEFKVGELYKIVDVGKRSSHHPEKDDYIDKIVKLIRFHCKRENDYLTCEVSFQEAFTRTNAITRRKSYSPKGRSVFFLEIKLEKV